MMARQSVVEFYDKSYGQRSKVPTIAASTQGDSRDFLPTAREWATINSSHTMTHKYRKIQLWKCCKKLLYFLFPFHFSFYSCWFSIPCHEVPIKYLFSSFSHPGWPGWTRTQVGTLTSFPLLVKQMQRIHCKEETWGRIPDWSIRTTQGTKYRYYH
jgi:hypothetical protein